jgi:glycosyltransferase involved in cell wall biosynthesis
VTQLRSQGHIVDVVSPDGQGNVDFAWDLRGGSKILQLFRLLSSYDRTVIQYHCAFFYNDPFNRDWRWETLQTTLCFILLFLRSRSIEVIAHEVPYFPGRKQRWLYGLQWKFAPKIVFHTRQELDRFQQHYRIRLKPSRVELRTHHTVFQKFAQHSQASARKRLNVPMDRLIFLCIGFIQRHKGFHRAMQAFAQANLPDAELYVVGSMRVPDAKNQRYLAELQQVAGRHPNIHLVESFVSNEEFDTWITASDWVVVPYFHPYSEIWSSGVLARTRLLERSAIVSSIGGLPDQSGEGDLVFGTDEELLSLFQRVGERRAHE